MSYGRFNGGQHFKKLNVKNVKVQKVSSETLEKLKALNIPIEKNLTEIRAKFLLKEFKTQNNID